MKHDIICIGSASIDVFITSKSKNIELEKIHAHEDVCFPIGAKILIDSLHTEVGGGGVNTSISFARLGFKTGLIAKLGADMNADSILAKLKQEKVNFLGRKTQGHTGYSVILTGFKKNRTILTHKGNNDLMTTADVPKKIDAKWLYLGTMLGKSWKTHCMIAKYAKKHGIKVLFNPSLYLAEQGKKFLKPVLNACAVLILNKEEAQAVVGKKTSIENLLKELQRDIPLVVITDGPRGAWAHNGMKTYSIVPTDVPVIEPTGAGDSFASGFLAALMLKQDIPTALRWGAAQANSVIQHFGAINKLLSRKEIEKQAMRAGRVQEE